MSIYGTVGRIWLERDGYDSERVEVWIQAVPAHIDYTGPIWDEWLPPPVPEDSPHPRAVFFCGPGTVKGSARNGQEYVHPLLVLTGEEWAHLPFGEIYDRLVSALGTSEGASPAWLEEHWQRTAGYYATRPHPFDDLRPRRPPPNI